MSTSEIQSIMSKVQGTLFLNLAFVGISTGLIGQLKQMEKANSVTLAQQCELDQGYVERWLHAAYGFELLDTTDGVSFELTSLGEAFDPDAPGNYMPFAVQSVLSTHLAERAAELMPSGERPGEKVLAERKTILPWFGPMLEGMFGPFLDDQILSKIPAFKDVDGKNGTAVDLGCGNGWYLRRLLLHFPKMSGIGLDGFDENIRQATLAAERDGVADRATFQSGDIYDFGIEEPVDLIAMNRAMHHVWAEKEKVFSILSNHLKIGGYAVIWEPRWPDDVRELRDPGYRAMAFQNLGEHIQGNHFLRPDEIVQAFEAVGMQADVYLFAEGREAVIVGKKV